MRQVGYLPELYEDARSKKIFLKKEQCQFSRHFVKIKYTNYRLPEMPTSQRKIVDSTKQDYRMLPKLSQFAKFNLMNASLNMDKFEFSGS